VEEHQMKMKEKLSKTLIMDKRTRHH
jgi:hypothetical protein